MPTLPALPELPSLPSLSSLSSLSSLPGLSSLSSFNGTEIAERVDHWVRAFGADPLNVLQKFNYKNVAIIGAATALLVILVDLVGYLWAAFKGTRRSYIPYSRSIFDFASDAWEDRNSNGIGEYLTLSPYTKSR